MSRNLTIRKMKDLIRWQRGRTRKPRSFTERCMLVFKRVLDLQFHWPKRRHFRWRLNRLNKRTKIKFPESKLKTEIGDCATRTEIQRTEKSNRNQMCLGGFGFQLIGFQVEEELNNPKNPSWKIKGKWSLLSVRIAIAEKLCTCALYNIWWKFVKA